MDILNDVMEKYISDVGYFSTDDFSNIKKLSEIILSIHEPKFSDKIKTRVGINRSINLAFDFFNSIDDSYGSYFENRLLEGAYDFEHVSKNDSSLSSSYFDPDLGLKKMHIFYRNQITDAFSIVHETFHDANLEPYNYNYTRNLFTEYISIFGEFLFENFISDIYRNCKASNNYSFIGCYFKALKVDFELSLFKCYLEDGFINDYSFNSIISSYPRKYHDYLLDICCSIIKDNDFDFDYQMRYLYGILFSCYSYDRFMNNDFDIEVYKFIHENINYLYPEEVHEFLGLDVIDDYMLLSPESYDKLSKSYRKVMGRV